MFTVPTHKHFKWKILCGLQRNIWALAMIFFFRFTGKFFHRQWLCRANFCLWNAKKEKKKNIIVSQVLVIRKDQITSYLLYRWLLFILPLKIIYKFCWLCFGQNTAFDFNWHFVASEIDHKLLFVCIQFSNLRRKSWFNFCWDDKFEFKNGQKHG